MEDILAVGGAIAGIVTFASLAILAITIWFIILCVKFLETSIERNKAQLKLINNQIQELEYKRTTLYKMEQDFLESQTKVNDMEIGKSLK